MKTTIKCDQPGCDYSRSVNPKYAAQTIGRHKLFAHGIKGKSDAAKARYAKKAKSEEPTEQPRNSEGEVVQKRPYTKRAKTTTPVNFCPACGCNMLAVAAAMGIGR